MTMLPRSKAALLASSVSLCLTGCLIGALPAHAQKPAASPTPAALTAPPTALAGESAPPGPKGAAGATRTVQVTPARPGTYSVWTESKAGSTEGTVMTLETGNKSLSVPLTPAATKLYVFDDATGTVAEYPTEKLKDGASVAVNAADFKKIRTVAVKVTASGGKPVEKAAVTFADASGTKTQKVLTSLDNGTARFENVAMGKATVSAQYGADGPKATQEVTIAPGKGGAPVEIEVPLSGSVPTLDVVPVTAIGSIPKASTDAPANPAGAPPSDSSGANNFLPGVIGIGLLVAAGIYGLRWAKNRGMTVAGSLKQIGVEMPQDGQGTAVSHLKPSPPPPPPLPSLAELPSAGAASTAGVAASGGSASNGAAATGKPRLVGLAGVVSGETFPLDEAFSVGREEGNSLALTQDTTVSRRHARVEPLNGGWAVVDAGSSNGTYVNGTRVSNAQPLSPGDEIQMGSVRFRFEGRG
jgi:hypothetical protein